MKKKQKKQTGKEPKLIACLGWGSLVWDPRELPREGTWQEGGPRLPIEFSRISSDGRLTLAIDPKKGESVPTRFVLSPRADLEDAVCDLRAREGTSSKHIGYIDLEHEKKSYREEEVGGIIRHWAKVHGFDAVVWTDLVPNFKKETDVPFSLDAAVKYLNGLPKNVAKQAREYIERAPTEVDTPLRRRLRDSGWLKRAFEMVTTDQFDKLIQAFAEWFEGEGFRPQPREYAKQKGKEEEAFREDLLRQVAPWVRENFPAWKAKKASRPKVPGAYGYHYTADINLIGPGGWFIPIELKVMKEGWEPGAALGQTIMQSRATERRKAVGAVLDVRHNPSLPGEAEWQLRAELWEKFGVRLCVRRAQDEL